MQYMRADRADIDALTEMLLAYIKADMGVSIEDGVSSERENPPVF